MYSTVKEQTLPSSHPQQYIFHAVSVLLAFSKFTLRRLLRRDSNTLEVETSLRADEKILGQGVFSHGFSNREKNASGRRRVGFGVHPVADPGGLPLAPKISSKLCSFQAILREKKPYFEQILGSGPHGVKTLLGPPDQNPGSAPATPKKLFKLKHFSIAETRGFGK